MILVPPFSLTSLKLNFRKAGKLKFARKRKGQKAFSLTAQITSLIFFTLIVTTFGAAFIAGSFIETSRESYLMYVLAIIVTLSGSGVCYGIIRWLRLDQQNQELVKKTKDLERSNRKLRRLGRDKDEFLTTVSHELRTPLSVIRGYVSLLLSENKGEINVAQRDFLTGISSNTSDLIVLVNDMLDLSTIESGQMYIRKKEVCLDRVINQVVESFQVISEPKGVELVFLNPLNFQPCIQTDEEKIIQILRNLIGNACKFTPENGRVEVLLKLDPPKNSSEVIIEVKDNGEGISKKDRPLIFDKFKQIHKKASYDSTSGTGLGLAICKGLIEKLGGKIIVKSTPNKGSSFIFTLPIQS